jgi:23S rRNA G2445 N2-methylase RlmL
LKLSTTEDVFLLAWGTDQLSYRAEDLERIRKWTERDADWQRLLQIHHTIRPKPKGKPTYRLVVQMQGVHGYRRIDAQKALARGLAGKLPASWRPAEENAAVEIWLTIDRATAACGLRLSDRIMRHRDYKLEHLRASLRPTMAAAMVRLAELRPRQRVLDPMCGAGTLLAEALLWSKRRDERIQALGGDRDRHTVRAALTNLRRLGPMGLACWDAVQLPLTDNCVDRVLCNPPFGVQLLDPETIRPLYRGLVREADRVLVPGGRAVVVVADVRPLRDAASKAKWKPLRQVPVRVLGQRATILVFRKPD